MLPEKLRVRNFMCYRDDVPTLDLEGIHVACLSGENGAGKSALLDAITWALWGKARVSSDDELIALGAQEMEVDLQFSVANNRYRVLRRRSSAKRGQTILEVQIETNGGWRAISGNSIRETQEVIHDVLRMEYDTFINSAFLVQGKADEFTRKAPAERKRVLAEILGLDDYDKLEARAKEQVRYFSDRAQGLEGTITSYREWVNKRDFYLSQEAEAQHRVQQLGQEIEQASTIFEQADQQRRALETRKAERDRELGRSRDLERQITESDADYRQLAQDIGVAQAIVERQSEIETNFQALKTARDDLVVLDQLREQILQLNDQRKEQLALVEREEVALQHQLQQHQRDQQTNAELIANKPSKQADLAALAEQLASFADAQDQLQQARNQRSELEQQSTNLTQLHVEVQRLQGLINVRGDSLIAAREEQNRRIIEADNFLANESRWRSEFETSIAQQKALIRDERKLQEMRSRDQQDAKQLGELSAQESNLEQLGKQINDKIVQLQATHDTHCPLCQSEIGHHGIQQVIEQYTVERDDMRAQYREAKQARKQLSNEYEARQREIQGLERKVAQLSTLAATVGRLEGQLSEAQEQRNKRSEAESTLRDLNQRIEHGDFAHEERTALAQAQAEISELGIDQQALDAQRQANNQLIAQLEQRLAQRGAIEAKAAVLHEQLERIQAAETQNAALHETILSLQVQLDSRQFAQAAQQQAEAIYQQMADLGYASQRHQEVREAVASLGHWEGEYHQLRSAQTNLANNQRQAQRLAELIERQRQDLAQVQVTIQQLNQELAQLPAAVQAAETAQRTINEFRGRLAVAQKDLGAAQQNVQHVAQVAEQLADAEKELLRVQEQRDIHNELVKAFGKKGIQAMLIETAIPELEREANELLSRMTDNQMHLRFETQRETKKGDTSETLDIQIADEQGTRRYDLYSGGEAFRINFAIRIAMSKMLARRAGANLQTLIIDEGFGSQDGRGRERLVEAITQVQADFNRILVITHIQELKDQFPVQIEITKYDDGSRWAVN
ncbi:AAA family ATPase [Herpetosiphon geysericola]|uniref:Nuclease SbcCD subunit C n=1 Tax=Herpetosiphon geysericola TaxID=70996 RepID=A0A0P6YU33_9CHLR|nr:SMC family ATPase [Herpetosiphon geysericola]KPL87061.1 hypothetical protein SE18_11265 [Herpetosiphon geysericola]